MASGLTSEPLVSTAFFPLRSSVELFKTGAEINAVGRAKESSLLYDRVVFETGLWEALISPTGSSGWWIPDHQLSWERIQQAHGSAAIGSPMQIAVGKQPGQGIPAKEMQVIVQGVVSEQHVAEFYTGILGELAELDPDWVGTVEIGGADVPPDLHEDLKSEIRWRNHRDFARKDLMRDIESFQRTYIYKSFNRDNVLAADLEATFLASTMFEPVIRKGIDQDAGKGAHALRILVPNVSQLPWEAIAEFRQHAAFDDARGHFREFERRALLSEPADVANYIQKVSEEIGKAMFQAFKEFKPNLPDELGKQAAASAISFIPGVGPVLDAAVGVATAVQDHRQFERSWIAATMKLADR